MPKRDGGEVLLELRNDPELRSIPVILLTALAKEAHGLANQGGITSTVISKPVELKQLLMEIEQHLDHSQSFSPDQQDTTITFDAPTPQFTPPEPEPMLPDPKTAAIRAGGAFGGLPLDQQPQKQPETQSNPFSCGESCAEGAKEEVPNVFNSLLQAIGEKPK